MKKACLLTSIFCILALKTSAKTCLTLNGTSYGNAALGANFTDYNFLAANEDPSFVYRPYSIQLCLNSLGNLSGMRAVVVKQLTSNNLTTSETALNRIGSVTETEVTCTNFTLDSKSYMSSLTVSYTSSAITRITLKSNNGTNLTRGKTVTGVQT